MPIPGPDQEPLLGGISLDFTERKRLQKQEKALQQQAQTSARLAAIGEMASGIAHEINNPLTSVVGFSELLLEEDLPPKIKDQLKIIAEGSHRVKEIIKNMLTFAHQTKPCKTLSNINLLIDSTLNLRSYVLKTSNIEVNKHFDPDLPWILVDPGQIQQVFLNIMVNAEWEMKKAHGRGTMTITTKNMGDHVRITFKDDGRGMNEEILAKLFNPFFTTKPTGEGTGLGLSLSRSIILDNNGTIDVESEPGQGATFIIDLPTNPEDDTEGQQTSIESKTAPENFKGVRVLVVDDEEPIRKLAGVMLVQKGYTVESTGDAREAIEKMENTTYDVVLVDIRMPGTNGIDLYNDIKARRPELVGRLIFITGDISNENTRGFLVKNKLSYVTKPFDRGMLLQKVGSVLSSRDAGRA